MLRSFLGKSIPPPFEKISPTFGAAKLSDVHQFVTAPPGAAPGAAPQPSSVVYSPG
jgi:hypothetical protein